MINLFFKTKARLARICSRTSSKLYLASLKRQDNITLTDTPILNGVPLIDIRKGCSLHIGKNVTLNSTNEGYHLNMHSPVKIYADRPGASIRIGPNTRIHGSCIHAYQSISIGKNCLIAANCQIFDGNGHDPSFPNVEDRINTIGSSKAVVIGDNVWLGANCIILPGVNIGHGAIISANSVVVNDIPPMVIAGGNPAVVVKSYNIEESALS